MSFFNIALILRHHFFCRWRQLFPMYKKLNDNGNVNGNDNVNDNGNGKKTVILMVKNETTFCGGLSDRLRGITSVYQECKCQGLDFKIHFETPNLIDYLEPNNYNWYIKDEDVCYDTKQAYPCTILTYKSLEDKKEPDVQRDVLRWFLKKDYKQIHVYTNMRSGDSEYGKLFHELFKPCKELQEQIDFHVKALGGEKQYDAMVFRFRQLLGDFKEGGETLSESEREEYIQRCMNLVVKEHESNPNKKILVTSDSITFLNRVSTLPFVYVIPGKVVHIGFTYDAAKTTYMKSFVDYYVLSYASKVTLVREKLMYHSGFALRAAMLNNVGYQEIWM